MKKWMAGMLVFLMLTAQTMAFWDFTTYYYSLSPRWLGVMVWSPNSGTWVFHDNQWMTGSGGAIHITGLDFGQWYWWGVWDYTAGAWVGTGAWIGCF